MTSDDVFSIVSNDRVILDLGVKLLAKYGPEGGALIRMHLRRCVLIVSKLRELTENCDFSLEDATKPEHFPLFLRMVHDISRDFKAPSLVLRVGECLEKLRKIAHMFAVIEKNEEAITDLQRFQGLIETEWEPLRARAHHVLKEIRRKKQQVLPLPSAVKSLSDGLKKRISKLFRNSENSVGWYKKWHSCCLLDSYCTIFGAPGKQVVLK